MTNASITSLPGFCLDACDLLDMRTCVNNRDSWCCIGRCGSKLNECKPIITEKTKRSAIGVIIAVSVTISVAIIAWILTCCFCCKGCFMYNMCHANNPSPSYQELVVKNPAATLGVEAIVTPPRISNRTQPSSLGLALQAFSVFRPPRPRRCVGSPRFDWLVTRCGDRWPAVWMCESSSQYSMH